MEFKKINYEIFKIKCDIKYHETFFCSGTKLNAKNELIVEQALKKTELNFYKVYNIIITKVITNSIFKNIKLIVNGVTLFIILNKIKLNNITIKKLNIINSQIIFLSIIINNKIYSNLQIKFINSIKSFIKNLFIFCRIIKIKLKIFNLKVIFSK